MSRRKRPAPPQDRPSPNHRYSNLSLLPGHQRHEPLDSEDRADLAVIEAAHKRGYRIAVQCIHCGHWLSSPNSVRLFAGPRCRAKAAKS